MSFRAQLASVLVLLSVSAEAAHDFEKEIKPLLKTFCFDCHGAKKAKGEVRLDKTTDLSSIYRRAATWDKVLTELRDEAMPPENEPQPSPHERALLVRWLEETLNNPDLDAIPKDPGQPFLHRLSKLEYNNTIRDLLGVDSQPANDFPPDGGGGGGFDNNSATLFVPPVLIEKYFAAAGKVLAEAKAERIFTARPSAALSPEAAAEKLLLDFTSRAFRRPTTVEDVAPYVQLFRQASAGGDSFEAAIRSTLRAVLVSPNFLFCIEQPRGTGDHFIGDYELASRLSYFLWSTMPDPELFRIAAEGRLSHTAELEVQVRRMLLDPKARAFAENFAGQWLHVHDLHTSAQPDPRRFPEYTPALREALFSEPIEFFHGLLREDASLLRLLDADYTYANETLAKHYGLPAVQGESFRKVALNDPNRGGVLTMGAVLTLTSYPQRTSPVLRGKWVLEEILGTPAPPPPPLIKSLPASDRTRNGLTFRQQLEKHREDPNCAGCHKRLDPLGLGLEHFDAIGRWREKIADQPVDATGEMITGEKFKGAGELKQLILKRKDDFARTVTEKMFAYALSRGLEYHDVPIVRRAVKTLAQSDYRVGALVMEIVKSYPFQYRRGHQPIAATQNLPE